MSRGTANWSKKASAQQNRIKVESLLQNCHNAASTLSQTPYVFSAHLGRRRALWWDSVQSGDVSVLLIVVDSMAVFAHEYKPIPLVKIHALRQRAIWVGSH